tara:strand:- start:2065 stop:2490 length:426 start_codon:yes stop_codon:yes gene_type:complete
VYKFNTNDYLVRIPLFIIFFWFGFLKIIDLSPAQQFVQDTVYWMPFLSAADWTVVIGVWEVFIAVFFLFKRTTFIAMILLMIQMTGTFLPLVILPEVTFQNSNPLLPTLEGQYIIKNIIIITAALIIGRTQLKVNFFDKIF